MRRSIRLLATVCVLVIASLPAHAVEGPEEPWEGRSGSPPVMAEASGTWWVNDFGGSSNDYVTSVAYDGADAVYVVGVFESTVDFDPGPGVTSLTSAGYSDIFVARFDAAGDLIWARRIGGPYWDLANDVALGDGDGVFVTGSFTEEVDFDPGAGTATHDGGGAHNAYLLRLDTDGLFVWAEDYGDGAGEAVAVDGIGGVYVVGFICGTDDNIGHMWCPQVLHVDTDGGFDWLGGAELDSVSGSIGAFDVVADAAGNAYVEGTFRGTFDFDPGAGDAVMATALGHTEDIFVMKLSSANALGWARRFGADQTEVAGGIALDGAGGLYFTGSFGGYVDFDPGAGVVQLGDGDGDPELFVARLTTGGAFSWANGYSDQSDYTLLGELDLGTSIAADALGRVFVTGIFMGDVDFEPGAGEAYLSAIGGSDAFILSLTASTGDLLWVASSGWEGGDAGSSLVLADAGAMYWGGYREQPILEPTDPEDTPGVYVNAVVMEFPIDTDGDGYDDLIDNFPLVPSVCRNIQATQIGNGNANTINGTVEADVIMGLGGNDTINGLGGDDLICGGDGADLIHGGDGKDKIYGDKGADTIYGDEMSDRIYGGDGNDLLRGDGGTRDRLYGGGGTDDLNGGSGDDDRCTLGETYSACEVIF